MPGKHKYEAGATAPPRGWRSLSAHTPPGAGQTPSRQDARADLCQRLVLESYAPAVVLINHKHDCLYSLGPTDRYLRVPPGLPTHDLLVMARDGMGAKLKPAIQQALQENVRSVVDGGLTNRNGEMCAFSIVVQPVQSEGEDLLLICFIDEPKHGQDHRPSATAPEDVLRVTMLEQELESASEELAASKEELQSLNEKLIALNSQLQETLERRRVAASHDLRQPLQALALLQGLLAETVQGEKERKLVAKLGEMLDGMSGVPDMELEVVLFQSGTAPPFECCRHEADEQSVEGVRRTGSILVVENDPEVRELIELFLKGEGYSPAPVPDGVGALEFIARGKDLPDLVLADYNLPGGMNGLQVTAKLREELRRQIPGVILTGDVSPSALRDIALQGCAPLNKPVKLKELTHVIQRLLPILQPAQRSLAPRSTQAASSQGDPVIFVVDDDSLVREAISAALEEHGCSVEAYSTCEAFLEAYRPGQEACLLIDAYLPGMNGLELLQRLRDDGQMLPAIMITGNSDVAIAVQAMKAGALDFIEKPFALGDLLASVERALEQSRDSHKLLVWRETATNRVASLTPRERQIMEMVLAGHPSKNIAADLFISQRTVENHRASIMKKTGSKSLPALARLALAAAADGSVGELIVV